VTRGIKRLETLGIEFVIGDLCFYIPAITYSKINSAVVRRRREWDDARLGLIFDIGEVCDGAINWIYSPRIILDMEALADCDLNPNPYNAYMLKVLSHERILEDWSYYFHPYIKTDD